MSHPKPRPIHTKIIATLGPASSDAPVLRRLIEAGTDVFRLNFSHGSLESHAQAVQRVREVADAMQTTVAVLGDLGGPKIRLGQVDEADGGMKPAAGDSLTIQREPIIGRAGRVSTNYDRFCDEVGVGDRVLIDDGAVRFIVTDKTADEVACRCTVGGVVTSRKGVNLPDTPLSIGSITDYDRQCVDWAVDHDLDYLALSFVRRAEELYELRERLLARGSEAHLVAKIEKTEAVRNIGPIIRASDAVMIARGDLGVEMDAARVPIIQKELIRRCREAGRPVIVATQMLQSMIASANPTRAEVSDVANAIYDATDAVMLSGETSIGRFPVLAVDTMNHVAEVTEEYLFVAPAPAEPRVPPEVKDPEEAALARGACEMARALHFKLIVAWSQSGVMARLFSKLRPTPPVVALSDDARALRRMALYFGVRPVQMDVPRSLSELIPRVDRMLLDRGLAVEGDPILIVAGTALGQPGRADAIMMHRVAKGGSRPE